MRGKVDDATEAALWGSLPDPPWSRLARLFELILVLFWLVTIGRLMIADVWDETNGLVVFHDASRTVSATVHLVWTQSLGFWRPLPAMLAAIAIRLLDRELSWRLLRWLDAGLIVAGLAFFRAALSRWAANGPWRSVLLTGLVLYSGGGIIVATWYANIFDASVFLALSAGLWLLAKDQPLKAGALFGIAFFCKETAALILPFLLVLVAMRRLSVRDALRAAIPASALGGLYFALRSLVIPFGSSGDVHQFQLMELWPSSVGFVQSFWRETMKGHQFSLLGIAVLVVSLFAIRNWPGRLASLLFIAAADVVYWGMFVQYQSGQVLSHLDFIGRLYFIPSSLMLFALLLDGPIPILAVVACCMLIGGHETYRDHARLQRGYAQLYSYARTAQPKPVRVFFPEKPLDDRERGLVIGADETSPLRLNARTGRLEAK